MPFNGTGVFQRVRNWVADATAGIKIRADYHDAEDDGFAQGLTNCITKDGQTIITQNIPWNSKRITALADPINDQDAATKKYTDVKFGSGGIMTGDLEIDKDHPRLILNDTDTAGADVVFQHMGKNRWIVRMNADAESGTDNTGSNFEIDRFADDGTTMLGAVTVYNRASGLGVLSGDPTAPLGIVTKRYTDTAITNGITGKVNRVGDTMTGQLVTATAVQGIGGGGAMGTIMVMGGQPAVTFHSPGAFATNFGMSTDGNFYMGGYSHSTNVYKFWTTRDFVNNPGAAVFNARWAYAGELSILYPGPNTTFEPAAGAALTGWMWGGAPGQVIGFRYRYMQLFTTAWFTIGYV